VKLKTLTLVLSAKVESLRRNRPKMPDPWSELQSSDCEKQHTQFTGISHKLAHRKRKTYLDRALVGAVRTLWWLPLQQLLENFVSYLVQRGLSTFACTCYRKLNYLILWSSKLRRHFLNLIP
jgi:hypothetical protein